jgi:hypothetical protein
MLADNAVLNRAIPQVFVSEPAQARMLVLSLKICSPVSAHYLHSSNGQAPSRCFRIHHPCLKTCSIVFRAVNRVQRNFNMITTR